MAVCIEGLKIQLSIKNVFLPDLTVCCLEWKLLRSFVFTEWTLSSTFKGVCQVFIVKEAKRSLCLAPTTFQATAIQNMSLHLAA